MSETHTTEAPAGGAPAHVETQKTFPIEYVRELREENKGLRHRSTASEIALNAAQALVETTKTETAAALKLAKEQAEAAAAEKVASASAKADERVKRAELRTQAIKAGMVDLDMLMALDQSTLKINDAGEVEGAEALIEAAKKSKPFLFGAATTSSTKEVPKPGPTTKKSAMDMTPDELRAAEKSKAWLK